MRCAQVTESLPDLESLSNGQASLFCTVMHDDLNGFGSPAVTSTKGPVPVRQSCKRNRIFYFRRNRKGAVRDTAHVTRSGSTVLTPVSCLKSWAGAGTQAAPPGTADFPLRGCESPHLQLGVPLGSGSKTVMFPQTVLLSLC